MSAIDSLTPNWSARYQNLALNEAINLYKERSVTLLELRDYVDVLFGGPVNVELCLEDLDRLKSFAVELKNIPWEKDSLDIFIKSYLEKNGLKMPMIGKPLRISLVGTSNAPAIVDLLLVLGKNEVLKRIL